MKLKALLLIGCGAANLFASAELDSSYAFRNIGVAVIRPDSNPIFTSQLQKAMESEVLALPRFAFSQKGTEALVPEVSTLSSFDGFATVTWVKAWDALKTAGADAGLVADIQKDESGLTAIHMALVSVNGITLYRTHSLVDDAKSVPSFVGTGRRMVREMASKLPFDATILSRDGYRVVLDHGTPELYAGMKISAFTIEQQNGQMTLVETGKIEITRAESKLSFGQVIVEKKPREVTKLNKIRFDSARENVAEMPLFPLAGRGLSSFAGFGSDAGGGDEGFRQSVTSFSKWTHGRYGSIDVDFVGSLLTWNRTGNGNANVGSDSAFFPGVAIGGELWFTRNWLAKASMQLALSGLAAPTGSGATNLNSQLSNLELMAGYRFRLIHADMTPMITLKFGYGKTGYGVDTAASQLAAVAGSYSGLKLGADLDIPLSDKLGMSLNTSFLAMPSYSQTPAAEVSSVSGWEFGISSSYFWTQTFQLEAGLSFLAHSADFVRTSQNGIISTSQNQRRFSLGARYFF